MERAATSVRLSLIHISEPTFKDGTCRDIGEASDQLDRHFLEKQVTKYYIYFPKELMNV